MKAWWKTTTQGHDNLKVGLEKRLTEIDNIIDQGLVSSEVLAERNDIRGQLGKFERNEMLDLAQKAKVKWSIEGDENTKFYHGVLKRKRSITGIKGVKVDGEWVTEV